MEVDASAEAGLAVVSGRSLLKVLEALAEVLVSWPSFLLAVLGTVVTRTAAAAAVNARVVALFAQRHRETICRRWR